MSAPRLQRIAAYVVCTDPGDRLLLCRLTSVTARPGAWTLPGGGIEFGEHPEVAALRELREETGLTGRLGDLLCVDSASGLVRDEDGTEFEMHRVRIVYRAEVDDGPLTHEVGGSTDRAEWFTREQVEHLDLVDVASLGARLAWRRQRTDRTEAERGVHP